MEYTSINEFGKFYFHDSIVQKIKFENSSMILEIDGVSVSAENSRKHIILTFKGFEITQIMLYGTKTYDCNRQIIQITDDKILPPESYPRFIDDITDNLPMDIIHGGLENNKAIFFDFFFKSNDFYHLTFKCSQFKATW